MTLAPGNRVDRYTVLHQLGRGGMAAVYCVQHQLLGTRHALKVLHDPAAGERLLREGRVQARLDPAHVVPVTDVLQVGGTHALVMPLVEGCSLAEVLAEHRLSEAEVAALFSQICAGVRAAHSAGVMHRDLKPANVLLEGKHGRVVARVADFGLARAEQDVGMTRTGAFLGTPAYASPEQLAGQEVDAQADLWALGVLLFELLTGTRPFRGDTFGELFTAVHAGSYDDSALPTPWRPAVASLLTHVDRRQLLDPPIEPPVLRIGDAVAEVVRRRVDTAAAAVAATPTVGPAPSSTAATPHNLPRERDAFVGRQADLEALHRHLADGAALVSLLGIGGTGKTRLAVHLGWRHLADWPGGVWFCDLSEARSVDGIVHAVARALDVALGRDPVPRLGHAIAARGRCLVILDNFEQVARHAPHTLGRWLDRAHDAQFVVTTREVLGLPGEVSLALAPLDADDAVKLFVARARAARRDFDPEPHRHTIGSLVTLLDQLPLAIELAAARVRVMSPDKLLDRMSQRFRLLTSSSGRRDRQATLRATLDWSWSLLTEDERSALAQLSVFEGGFTLEAAAEVLDLAELWAEDAVQALVDKSLVRVVGDTAASDDRFDLLVSVQEYAAERLDEAGARLATETRHATHFAQHGTPEALAVLGGHGGVEARHTLTRELDNLVAACRRCGERDDGARAVALLQAAWEALEQAGPYETAVDLAQRVASLPALDARGTAASQLVLGSALHAVGRIPEAQACYESSLDAWRRAGERHGERRVLGSLGNLHARRGRADQAHACYDAAMAIHSPFGDRRHQGILLGNRGNLHFYLGELDDAVACYEAALAIHREVGNRREEGRVLGNLGGAHVSQGRVEAALEYDVAAPPL